MTVARHASHARYDHCLAVHVPAGLEFHVAPGFEGKPIEVALTADEGYKRVRNVVTGSAPTYFRRMGTDDRADAAFRALQSADTRRKRR